MSYNFNSPCCASSLSPWFISRGLNLLLLTWASSLRFPPSPELLLGAPLLHLRHEQFRYTHLHSRHCYWPHQWGFFWQLQPLAYHRLGGHLRWGTIWGRSHLVLPRHCLNLLNNLILCRVWGWSLRTLEITSPSITLITKILITKIEMSGRDCI